MRTPLAFWLVMISACSGGPLYEVPGGRGEPCSTTGGCLRGLICEAETCVALLEPEGTEPATPPVIGELDPVQPEPEPEPEPEPCTYPSTGVLNGVGDVMSNLSFTALENNAPISVSLESIYCDPARSTRSLAFVLTAEWCPSCPQYVQHISTIASEVQANDALLILVDLQTRSYQDADNDDADAYFDTYLPSGMRVGSAALTPGSALDQMWPTVPNGFVVRLSDMKVIAHQESSQYRLDYVALTGDPERDWGNGAGPGNVAPICDDDDDESSEPNDGLAQAAMLSDNIVGGICGDDDDFYEVALTAPWRATLRFSHSQGDLDVELLNAAGQRVSIAESADDDEVIEGEPGHLLRIYGYNGARAVYTLEVAAR